MPAIWQQWMALDIDAWQGSSAVQQMSDTEQIAYLNLILAEFQQPDGMLPSDEKELAKLSRRRPRWAEVREIVLEQFKPGTDGRIFNERCLREWGKAKAKYESGQAKAAEVSRKRSESGKKGAEKRWGSSATSNGSQSDSNCHDEAMDEDGNCCSDGSHLPNDQMANDSLTSTSTSTSTKTREEEKKDRPFRNSTELDRTQSNANERNERAREPYISEADIDRIFQAYPRHNDKIGAIISIRDAFKFLRQGHARPPMSSSEAICFLLDRVRAFSSSPAGKNAPEPAVWFSSERFFEDDQQWSEISYATTRQTLAGFNNYSSPRDHSMHPREPSRGLDADNSERAQTAGRASANKRSTSVPANIEQTLNHTDTEADTEKNIPTSAKPSVPALDGEVLRVNKSFAAELEPAESRTKTAFGRVMEPVEGYKSLAAEIVCAHPVAISRNMSPKDVPEAYLAVVREAVTAEVHRSGGSRRSAEEYILAMTEEIAFAVARWPSHDLQFLAHVERFYRERQYRRPIEEWQRGEKYAGRVNRSQERTNRNIAAFKRAFGVHGDLGANNQAG